MNQPTYPLHILLVSPQHFKQEIVKNALPRAKIHEVSTVKELDYYPSLVYASSCIEGMSDDDVIKKFSFTISGHPKDASKIREHYRFSVPDVVLLDNIPIEPDVDILDHLFADLRKLEITKDIHFVHGLRFKFYLLQEI